MSAADRSSVDDWGPGLWFRVKALNTKSVGRAKTCGQVLPVCLAHNLRQGNEAHRHRSRIDTSRSHLNEVWAGPECLDQAEELVRDTFQSLGIEPRRKDAIMGVEMVFQPPPDAALPAFWAECLAWTRGHFECLVSAVVHHDQKRPHMHVLVLAVVGRRLAGNELTASSNRTIKRRADFMAHMRRTLGLRPDRKFKSPKTVAELALSSGKGPKSRAAALQRDAKLERLASPPLSRRKVGMGVDGHGGSGVKYGNPHAQAKAATPLIAHPSHLALVSKLWPKPFGISLVPRAPLTPCPSPPRSVATNAPPEWWKTSAANAPTPTRQQGITHEPA